MFESGAWRERDRNDMVSEDLRFCVAEVNTRPWNKGGNGANLPMILSFICGKSTLRRCDG